MKDRSPFLVTMAITLAIGSVGAPPLVPPAAAAVATADSGAVPAPPAVSRVTVADLPAVLAAVRAPGARAVLVNVWATWCDPCREELPELLRFYRQHRAMGLRLVLVSADDEEQRAEVGRVLAEAGGADLPTFIKHGDDDVFVNGLDPRWSGALPATFLYDGRGNRRRFWPGVVSYRALETGVGGLLRAKDNPETKRRTP
jgi:thiol-disulfide isomerase/thioredoxin